MPIQIQNHSSGVIAGVDIDNRLRTRAVSLSQEQWVSQRNGLSYCGTSGETTLDNLDGVALYLKNTSSTQFLVIEKLMLTFQTASAKVTCRRNDTGDPATTSTVPQININFSAGAVADSTLLKPSGTGITGLTAGDVIATFHDLPVGLNTFPIEGTFVLSLNDVFSVSIEESDGTAQVGRTSWVLRYMFVDKDIILL